MTIRRTAYDTSAGSAFVTTKLKAALEEIAIKEYTVTPILRESHNGDFLAGVITGTSLAQNEIPVFAHPFEIKKKDREHQIFMDYRAVVGSRKYEGAKPAVIAHVDFRMLRLRQLLNVLWLGLNPQVFRDVSFVPAAVYASWISQGLGKKFGLDPKEQQQIGILAAVFYQTLFYEDNKIEKDKLEAAAIRATRSPYQLVTETISQVNIEELVSIADLVEAIKKTLDNPRLNGLSSGAMIMFLQSGWFGLNAREVLPVALEHPPTWLTVVYFSLLERTYRNAGISHLSKMYEKAKGGDSFIRSLDNVTEDYKSFADPFFEGLGPVAPSAY